MYKKKYIEPVLESDFTIHKPNAFSTEEMILPTMQTYNWMRWTRIILLVTTLIGVIMLWQWSAILKLDAEADFIESNEIFQKRYSYYLIYLGSQIIIFILTFFYPRISCILALISLYGYFTFEVALLAILIFYLMIPYIIPVIAIVYILFALKIIVYVSTYKSIQNKISATKEG
jgi:hypothetical protein